MSYNQRATELANAQCRAVLRGWRRMSSAANRLPPRPSIPPILFTRHETTRRRPGLSVSTADSSTKAHVSRCVSSVPRSSQANAGIVIINDAPLAPVCGGRDPALSRPTPVVTDRGGADCEGEDRQRVRFFIT